MGPGLLLDVRWRDQELEIWVKHCERTLTTGIRKEFHVLKSVLTAATGGGNTESSLQGPSSVLSWKEGASKVPDSPVFLGCLTKPLVLLPTHLKMYFYHRTDDRGNPLVSGHPLSQPSTSSFCFASPLLHHLPHQLIPLCVKQLRSLNILGAL